MAAAVCAAASAFGVEWANVDAEHHRAGRKCSAGYLQGKVVLVARDGALAERMEEVWGSFRTKPFVLLGAFAKDPGGVTYPVYAGAGLKTGAPEAPLYAVDETGKVIYRGKDERRATEVVVSALTDLEAPKNDVQLKRFLEWELVEMPGRAILRYRDFKKRDPKGAKVYEAQVAALEKQSDVKKLVELVGFAKAAKDIRAFDPKKAKAQKEKFAAKIKLAQGKFSKLKESENEKVAREAKNALADLTWTLAEL